MPKKPNKRRRCDGIFVAATPPPQSRACCGGLTVCCLSKGDSGVGRLLRTYSRHLAFPLKTQNMVFQGKRVIL